MAISEEAIIAVSETETVETGNGDIVVKEAFGGTPDGTLPTRQPSPEPQPVLPPEPQPLPSPDGEPETRFPASKGWMDSQEAKDFMPFLLGEMRRIKQPGACARNRNEAERALGQHKRLDNYVSKALREDWKGEIPIADLDRVRQQLEQNIEALERMLEAHHEMKRSRKQVRRHRRASDGCASIFPKQGHACPKCAAPLWEDDGGNPVCLACDNDGIRKEAATPHFEGLQYQISAFERALVGTLINAVVSGGRDLEELFKKLEKKYKLEDREVLAIRQILSDMGYPVFKDRARIGENEDPSDPDEPREWQSQYYA
jgi:hypothetical protein